MVTPMTDNFTGVTAVAWWSSFHGMAPFFLAVDTYWVCEDVHSRRCADINDNKLSSDVKILESVSIQIDG